MSCIAYSKEMYSCYHVIAMSFVTFVSNACFSCILINLCPSHFTKSLANGKIPCDWGWQSTC